ncbi:hypothetical protein NFI96_009567 [Prochilodus magdalenae]|nr:hypothetical protein NFI96_009567 [Prochilodus magdalenae]
MPKQGRIKVVSYQTVHGVTQNGSGVIFSDESRFSLGGDAQRTRVWSTVVSTKMNGFVVTRPEDLVSLHLHPYPAPSAGTVLRMFKLHGMDYHRTPLVTSTAPYRDVWRVGLANTAARCHTERQTSIDSLLSNSHQQPLFSVACGNRFALLWPDAENTKGVILGNNTIPILKSQQTTVFLPVVYIFIFIVGLPTNAMAIWVFLFRTKKKNPTSILMANLALADLLFIVWLPLKVAYHLNGNDWIFGESLCRVLVGFFYGNMYCSTIFIACISAQRYWTVAHPLSHKLNTRVTACVCVGVWVVVWLITVPLYLYEQTVKVLTLNTTTCHDVTRRNQTHFPVGYFLTMGIMGYVVPCVVCVVAYLLTFSLSQQLVAIMSH